MLSGPIWGFLSAQFSSIKPPGRRRNLSRFITTAYKRENPDTHAADIILSTLMGRAHGQRTQERSPPEEYYQHRD